MLLPLRFRDVVHGRSLCHRERQRRGDSDYLPPRQVSERTDPMLIAMWLMFCRAPKEKYPEPDGFYSLGEIGQAPEKKWTRPTPYSLAQPEE